MSQIETPSLAIVVASCDKYSDLWEPLFGEFFRYWPECKYPIYLIANKKTYDDPRVTTLLAGEDVDWTSTVARSLEKLQHSHILFWIDDAFLDEKVKVHQIEKYWNLVKELDMNFLRLRPNPLPEKKLNSEIGILGLDATYRVTLFATIWKMTTLKKILIPGESAWEFEIQGTERSRGMEGFYSILGEIFSYQHGVERGIWIRGTCRYLELLGYDLNFQYRRCMSYRENLGYLYRMFKSYILHSLPERRRKQALNFIRSFYKLIGWRT